MEPTVTPPLLVAGKYKPAADGFDISHWNTIVAPVKHYRLESFKATEGGSFVSPTLRPYWALTQTRTPRYRGLYHWLRPDWTAEKQAADFLATVQKLPNWNAPGVIYQLDWERTAGLTAMPTVAEVERWIELVQSVVGNRVIVYASDWVQDFKAWRARNPQIPVWYANYNLGTRPVDGYPECDLYNATIWQWTSSYPEPSFARGIDMNHIIRPSTLDVLAGYSFTPVPVPPQPTPVTGASMFKGFIKYQGTTAIYAYFTGGNKLWLPSLDALNSFRFIHGLDPAVTPVAEANVATMQATGPVVGDLPAGVDQYGIPAKG